MAQSQSAMRRSYDQFRAQDDDDEPQLSNFQNRSVTLACSFCEETFPSSAKLSEHLLLCGNKTDQCPNCYKLIRRSHFAYHYENNCAPIERVETPPPPTPPPRSRSAQHSSTNSNKPYAREDVPDENYPPRINGRMQSATSTPRSSPGLMECEFCRHRCAPNDYKIHKDNCLRNPVNVNNKPQLTRITLGSNQNQNNSNGIVHIPCEICNEPIDVPNWSKHVQNCRERDQKRIAMRAQSMSHEPVTEKLPCEHCERLYSARELEAHQTECPNNPANMNPRGRGRRPQPSKSNSLPTRFKNDRNRATSADGGRSRINIRDVQYQRIDHDRTLEANRPFDGDRPIGPRNANQNPIRHSPNDDIVLRSGDPLRNIEAYDNEPMRGNRQRPPNGVSQRERSSFDNLRNIEDTQDPNGRAAHNRSPYLNNPRGSHQLRQGRQTFEVIDNHPDRPLIRKHKKPSFFKSLFCATRPAVEND
jgi:hypothetical protein